MHKYGAECTYLLDMRLDILDGRNSQLVSTEKTTTMGYAVDVSGKLASIFGAGASREIRGVPGAHGMGDPLICLRHPSTYHLSIIRTHFYLEDVNLT